MSLESEVNSHKESGLMPHTLAASGSACDSLVLSSADLRLTHERCRQISKKDDSLVLFIAIRRFLKVDCTVRVRGPVRTGIDSVLCCFLQIEEHLAAEDAEERRAAECLEHGGRHERRFVFVFHYDKD